MEYVEVPYTAYIEQTLSPLDGPGLLLVSAGADSRPNAMVIGWGTIGVIWGRPMFTVLIRPSRYTYKLLGESDSFTVCVPTENMSQAVDFCGNRSGRDYDKFTVCGLTALPSTRVSTPGIEGCPVIYECQIVNTMDLVPTELNAGIRASSYPKSDFHRVYNGEILAVRALSDAANLLEY